MYCWSQTQPCNWFSGLTRRSQTLPNNHSVGAQTRRTITSSAMVNDPDQFTFICVNDKEKTFPLIIAFRYMNRRVDEPSGSPLNAGDWFWEVAVLARACPLHCQATHFIVTDIYLYTSMRAHEHRNAKYATGARQNALRGKSTGKRDMRAVTAKA